MTRPSRPTPAPVEVDDVKIIAACTGLWLIALVVLLVGFRDALDRRGQGWVIWAGVAGFVLGVLGVAYCARRKRRLVRSAGPAG